MVIAMEHWAGGGVSLCLSYSSITVRRLQMERGCAVDGARRGDDRACCDRCSRSLLPGIVGLFCSYIRSLLILVVTAAAGLFCWCWSASGHGLPLSLPSSTPLSLACVRVCVRVCVCVCVCVCVYTYMHAYIRCKQTNKQQKGCANKQTNNRRGGNGRGQEDEQDATRHAPSGGALLRARPPLPPNHASVST